MARLPVLACSAFVAVGFATACSRQPPSASAAPPPPTPAQAAILAALPEAYRHADLENGQAKFALCRSCHTARQGEMATVGPNLCGVFGRRAGSAPGYPYSADVRALGITWDAETLNRWIAGPRAMAPGTHMTFIGLENPKDRTDLVAYLKVTSTAVPN